MNIIFEQLEVQNFKSIGECIKFVYTDFSGLNFIIGKNLDQPGSKNGSGKSVLTVDALVFALFGRTLKNTNNMYIANRYCSKKLETFSKVTFVVDNVRYRSESYIKNSSTVKMLLYKENINEESGWEDLTQCSVIKTRQYIQDTILNCTFDIFKTAIIIAASDCLNFYEGMNKNQKRNYVENIFNLACFGYMFSFAKSDLNDIKKEITYSNTEIIKITNDLNNLKIKSESFLTNLNESLLNTKNILVNSVKEYKDLNTKINNISLELETVSDLNNKYIEYKNEYDEIKNKSNNIDSDINKIQYKIETLRTTLSELLNVKNVLLNSDNNKLLDEINNNKNEISQLNNQLNDKTILYHKFEDLEEKLNKFKADLLNLTKEKQTIENNIIKLTYDIKSIEKTKTEFDDIKTILCDNCIEKINKKYNYNEKNNKIDSLNISIKDYNLKLDELIKNINLLTDNITKIENKLIEKQSIISEIKLLNKDIKYKTNSLSKLELDYENSKTNNEKIINLESDYSKKEESIKKLNNLLLEKNSEKNDILIKINTLKQNLVELEPKSNEYIQLKNDLMLLKNDYKYKKNDILKLKEEYQKIQLQTTKNPYSDLINETTKKLQDEQTKLQDLHRNYIHIEVLKNIFSETGVKRHIIKNLVSLLNSLIQKYLSEFGVDFLVCFDDSFEFKFLTLNGECEYSNFSAGEKQRIQIATMLAFRDLILHGKVNSNILIIDEMLDQAVDSIAIKKITNILQRKSIELNQTTFVISHRSEITEDNIFNNIIEVTKENGFSTINII